MSHINLRYSSGRTTGIVLDSGDGVTHAVPVFEGFSMPHAIRRVDVAGRWFTYFNLSISLTCESRDVTDHLQLLLRKSGHHLHTTAEREVVRTIKEKCCYVALNPAKEEKDALGRTEDFRLPDGNIVQVMQILPQTGLFSSASQKAWSRTLPCSWNLIQPRADWARVCWSTPGCCWLDQPGRPGSSEELVFEHCFEWG